MDDYIKIRKTEDERLGIRRDVYKERSIPKGNKEKVKIIEVKEPVGGVPDVESTE